MNARPVLTAAQMREVDCLTIEAGVPSSVLMENAGMRVVEFMIERFGQLNEKRIVVYCGKGNNGGDGFVIARQLLMRFHPSLLAVVLIEPAESLAGDAAAAYRMFVAAGGAVVTSVSVQARCAHILVDAVLGTGIQGPLRGNALEAIRDINSGFPSAFKLCVDIPSGIGSDTGELPEHEYVRADATVTFSALKVSQVLGPACYAMGELRVAEIGSGAVLAKAGADLAQVEPATFRHLLKPRTRESNKGMYGHVLVVAGSRFKSGAAAMSGMASLRAGAGLVTVASPVSAVATIAAHAPELMTEPLAETADGAIHDNAITAALRLAAKRPVTALGPGLGTAPETATFVRALFRDIQQPMVVDADALNILSNGEWPLATALRVLTPHPGEMSRLTGLTLKDLQSRRVAVAREFAAKRNVILVLKGDRTLIAFPEGNVWINPTGSPAMATGGTGDILTGMIAGLLAQFPKEPEIAVANAVYLHGLAGELGARELGELPLVAMDLLRFLPSAIHACSHAL
jgi:hydroxyethylthiazole kinase-like uncharacterized protein yjeF